MRGVGLVLCGGVAVALMAGQSLAPAPALAPVMAADQPADLTGEQIMRRVAEADGVRDLRGHVTFKQVSADKREQVTFGLLQYKQSPRQGKGSNARRGVAGKILFTVLTPPRLSGLGFLAWTYPEPGRVPDQWLYLPELRQVRRITPRDPLEGTADTVLTFADMRPRPIEEERDALLRSEPFLGQTCWVVESRPQSAETGYRRRLLWVDPTRHLVLKIEYYDQKDTLLKTQLIEWQQVAGVWTWKASGVTNIQTGQRTSLDLHVLQVNAGLDDDLFTERALRAGIPP